MTGNGAGPSRPPGLARRLLARALPPDAREAVVGDLEEVFRRCREDRGPWRARLWYWSQAVSFSARFLWERLRERTARAAPEPVGTADGRGRRPGRAGGPRSSRGGGGRVGVSWLDVKLGLRMLVKYPGLTVVGGVGLAVAIAIGAGSFGVIYTLMDPALPLDEGDRIVTIQNWDAAIENPNRGTHLHDLATWRGEIESVEDLGAFRTVGRNLIAPDGTAEPVRIAEMSASGFRVARVPPVLGRPLVDADERVGAPPVVVIGYDVWRNRFGGDPEILGRTLRLGTAEHRVVGVMPEGFAFPVNHGVWTPLRLNPSEHERGEAPSVTVFGRLSPGAGLDEARAEVTTIGRRLAADFPETHEQIRPQVLPYTYPFVDIDSPELAWAFHILQALVSMLLVVVGVNVAILVYARTATRAGEIAVRSALGASRRRIVAQLFVEALALSAVAGVIGLGIAGFALGAVNASIDRMVGGELPFWMDFGLSSGTIVYVAGLAVLAAVIVGVVPALKATGRRVRIGLQRIGSGGSGMQLGRTWTVLIVAQVAVAVAVLPAAVYSAGESIRYGFAEPGFAADQFLTARAEIGRDARSADLQTELARRVAAEPGISDVVLTMSVPGEEPRVWVEVDGVPMPEEVDDPGAVRSGFAGHRVGIGRVGPEYFDAFDVPILTGRPFRDGDLESAATAIIVNRTFVRRVLGGSDALGRRVRYVGRGGDVSPDNVDLGRWYEIVGVVPDFPNRLDPGLPAARVYHALAPGQIDPVRLVIRVGAAAPATFTGRLRAIAAALDPTLRVRAATPLDEALGEEQVIMRLVALGITLVTLSVLLLSAAGIYALMSFTVTRRRREIGIRTALGADPSRLLASIFSRATGQLALGVVIGLGLATLLLAGSGIMNRRGVFVLFAVAALMMVVGLAASFGPARRGLRIQPTEALRAEA